MKMKNKFLYAFLIFFISATFIFSCSTKDVDPKDISIFKYARNNNNDWLYFEVQIGKTTYAIREFDYYTSSDTMYVTISRSSNMYSSICFFLNRYEIDHLMLEIDSTTQYINIQNTSVIPIDSLEGYKWREEYRNKNRL